MIYIYLKYVESLLTRNFVLATILSQLNTLFRVGGAT